MEEINLTTTELPAEADAVLINAPQTDLTTDDLDTLAQLSRGGGRLLVTTQFCFTKHQTWIRCWPSTV